MGAFLPRKTVSPNTKVCRFPEMTLTMQPRSQGK
jgi:hypothetical protein